jgi:hypothetical protein
MAIAPNTQEFFNLKQSVESEINAGNITTKKQLKELLESRNIDFNQFMSVDKEYERRKKAGTLTEDTTFDLGKIVGSAVGKAAEDVGQVGGDVIEFVGGKETRKTVEGAFQDAANFLDENLPTEITYAAKETFDPRVNLGEDVAAELGSYAVPAAGLTKATKFIKPQTRAGRLAKGTGIGIGADVLSRGEDETFVTEFAALVPESEEVLQQLAIDPDDGVAERRLKQIVDSAIAGGVIAIPAAVAFKLLKGGGRKLLGKFNSVRNEGITTPITPSPTATATRATVEETTPGTFRQRGQIGQAIAKINTKLGRALTSTAGLPQPLFEAFIRKNQFVQASSALIQKEARALEKVLKNSDVDKQLVNRLLTGETLSAQEMAQIPEEIVNQVMRMRTKIDNNSRRILDSLNLPDDNKLRAVIDPDTGGAYLTRTFEFSTNPKWSKDIAKAIKNKLPDTPHNADVLSAVRNAQTHLARNNPELSPEQINGLIMDLVDRGKKDTSFNVLSELISNGTGGPSAKILRGRKELDRPILELLGEVKDPVRNFTETMTNQNKLIAKANYIQDIKKFAEQNVGRDVRIKGLLPFLPEETTTFLRKAEVTPSGLDVRESLESLAQKELGAFGAGGEAVGLNKFVTTKEFSDMLDKGIDTFGVDNPVGKGWLNIFAKPAAVGQAMETVFDHTAHLVNTYGMVQQLGMNGVLYRPKVVKEAVKSAKAMYAKAAKGDEETLKFLQALKNRGIIDSSVVAENIKKNIDRFGEGAEGVEGAITKAIKAPFRGMSAVYGGVDDFGKIISFQAEYNAYKKALPNLTDEEVFNLATETVRNTMPSYTTAAPAVRALARLPFGTYATFPAEMVRTTKNILMQGAKDIAEGKRTNNPELIKIGMRRLAGIGATTAGIEYAIRNNNSQNGISENEIRSVNLTVPDYQRNTEKVFTQPFYKDPNTGKIMTRFIDSGTLDSMQYIKGPTRAVIARVLAGEDITQRELDDAMPDAIAELYSPFVSEKFLTEAVINAYRGVDEEGNELSTEERVKGLLSVGVPGSAKAFFNLRDAYNSEELRGLGKGQTSSSFPKRVGTYLLPSDQAGFFATGIRNNTYDLDGAVSYSLYQDSQEINNASKEFNKYLKTIKDKQLTQKDVNDILEKYVETQMAKKEAMARMSDKVNVFRNVEFYQKGKDGKIYKPKYGIDNIVKASTGKGKYKINPNLIYGLVEGSEGQGVFIPDSINSGQIKNMLVERKFPPALIKGLKQLEAGLTGQPLRKVAE